MSIERMSFSYLPEQKKALQVAAERENRKLSQMVQVILSEWIDNNPEKCGIVSTDEAPKSTKRSTKRRSK